MKICLKMVPNSKFTSFISDHHLITYWCSLLHISYKNIYKIISKFGTIPQFPSSCALFPSSSRWQCVGWNRKCCVTSQWHKVMVSWDIFMLLVCINLWSLSATSLFVKCIHLHSIIPHWCGIPTHTVRCRYNAVTFLTNIHKRHPIARPSGQGMGWVSYVDPVSDRFSASVPLSIYVISYNIGPQYSGTRLYMEKYPCNCMTNLFYIFHVCKDNKGVQFHLCLFRRQHIMK